MELGRWADQVEHVCVPASQLIIMIQSSPVDQMLSVVPHIWQGTIDLLELDPLRQSFRSLVILLHMF